MLDFATFSLQEGEKLTKPQVELLGLYRDLGKPDANTDKIQGQIDDLVLLNPELKDFYDLVKLKFAIVELEKQLQAAQDSAVSGSDGPKQDEKVQNLRLRLGSMRQKYAATAKEAEKTKDL